VLKAPVLLRWSSSNISWSSLGSRSGDGGGAKEEVDREVGTIHATTRLIRKFRGACGSERNNLIVLSVYSLDIESVCGSGFLKG
jgi:hypothetical protein